MGVSTGKSLSIKNRESIDARISDIFQAKSSLADTIKTTRAIMAETRELLAEVDRINARR